MIYLYHRNKKRFSDTERMDYIECNILTFFDDFYGLGLTAPIYQ